MVAVPAMRICWRSGPGSPILTRPWNRDRSLFQRLEGLRWPGMAMRKGSSSMSIVEPNIREEWTPGLCVGFLLTVAVVAAGLLALL